MIKTMLLPDIGAEEATVAELLVAPGDKVQEGQSLMVVEGDKASIEIPIDTSGRLVAWLVKTGDRVKSGTPWLQLEPCEEPNETATSNPATATLVTNADDSNASKDTLAAQEPTLAAGVTALDGERRDTEPYQAPTPAAEPPMSQLHETGSDLPVLASPGVRRLARLWGVPIDLVQGTGSKQRVTVEDLQRWSRMHRPTAMSAVSKTQQERQQRLSLSRVKQVSGKRLSQSWQQIPHVTQFATADITELERFRKSLNAASEHQGAAGRKLTLLPFVLKVLALCLQEMPLFHGKLVAEEQVLLIPEHCHLGVAVQTPAGLLVPVVRHVDQRGLYDIAEALSQLAQRAREGKLPKEAMQGGTFTVSNLGAVAGGHFTPIINPPEVAILGISQGVVAPVWDGTSFVPRTRLPLSLSYDHRVIDGVEGIRFLARFTQLLEDVRRCLL